MKETEADGPFSSGPKADSYAIGRCEDGHVVIGLLDADGRPLAEGHMQLTAARAFLGKLFEAIRRQEAVNDQQVGHA